MPVALSSNVFHMRVSVNVRSASATALPLTGDEPRFVLRIVQTEAQEEAIANEFRDLLISKFDGESVETFNGNFKA